MTSYNDQVAKIGYSLGKKASSGFDEKRGVVDNVAVDELCQKAFRLVLMREESFESLQAGRTHNDTLILTDGLIDDQKIVSYLLFRLHWVGMRPVLK